MFLIFLNHNPNFQRSLEALIRYTSLPETMLTMTKTVRRRAMTKPTESREFNKIGSYFDDREKNECF